MGQWGYGDVLHRSQSLIILGTDTPAKLEGSLYLQSQKSSALVSTDFSGDHPFNAKVAENEELLLIYKQTQPVLLLGGGSPCTLLAG